MKITGSTDVKSHSANLRDTLRALQKTQGNARNLSVDLGRADPYQMHNKTYRSQLVGSNIIRKAVQLYSDLTTIRNNEQIQAIVTARSTREQIKDFKSQSLVDLLRSRLTVDIGDLAERIRGKSVDKSN
jgi:hypothetical protein